MNITGELNHRGVTNVGPILFGDGQLFKDNGYTSGWNFIGVNQNNNITYKMSFDASRTWTGETSIKLLLILHP